MGCLSVHIRRVGDALRVRCGAVCPVDVNAGRVGDALRVRCGLVCSVGDSRYLNVEPEHIWLMESNDFMGEVVVWSNTSWTLS